MQDESKLSKAISKHGDYIATEVLAVRMVDVPLDVGAFTTSVVVGGTLLRIELRKVQDAYQSKPAD